jgi:DNA-binding NarL/FixJ family response regulator
VVKPALLLVGDAHQNMLDAVWRLLRELFEAVVMAPDGDSLLQVFRAMAPDLVIVDFSLPVSGAENVLRRLRLKESAPRARVIVLSVHDEPEAASEAFAAGAMGFVLKRAAATDLIPAVRRVLQDQTYVSPGVLALAQPPAAQR